MTVAIYMYKITLLYYLGEAHLKRMLFISMWLCKLHLSSHESGVKCINIVQNLHNAPSQVMSTQTPIEPSRPEPSIAHKLLL